MDPILPPEGEVVAEHRATFTGRLAALLLLGLPGAFCVWGATAVDEGRVPLAAGAVVLLALCVLAFVQQANSRVVVRPDGLERWGLRGKLWALRWQDAQELHYRVIKVKVGGIIGALLPAVSTQFNIALSTADGKKHKVPSGLKGIDVLGERVIEQQTTARLPDYRNRLDAGEELQFGKSLRLDKEKISTKKLFGGFKSCPLTEVEKVTVEAGYLKIRQKGKTFAFANLQVGSIPNVFVLLRLFETLLGAGTAGAAQGRDFGARAYV